MFILSSPDDHASTPAARGEELPFGMKDNCAFLADFGRWFLESQNYYTL